MFYCICLHREHFVQCPQGVLKKHYENLIQCDMHLKCLGQQSKIVHAPFFVSPACGSEGDISGNHLANQLVAAKVCPLASVALPLSASSNVEQMGTLGIAPLHHSEEASSPSSGNSLINIERSQTIQSCIILLALLKDGTYIFKPCSTYLKRFCTHNNF